MAVTRLDIEAKLKETNADFARLKMRKEVEAALATGDKMRQERLLRNAAAYKKEAAGHERCAGILRTHQKALETVVNTVDAANAIRVAMKDLKRVGVKHAEDDLRNALVQVKKAEATSERLATAASVMSEQPAVPCLDSDVADLTALVEKLQTEIAGVPDESERSKMVNKVIEQL